MKLLNTLKFILLLMLAFNFSNCSSADSRENKAVSTDRDAFNKYWYAGKAEITRYELDQARYGEIRKGDAVLIFVTEPFLTDKQVKHEFGDSKNSTSVLKLNSIKKFYTGIYPYSMMTSVFTPVEVDKHATLKVTSSNQEWCGQTFMQLNNRNGKIEGLLRSYFQNEGDQNFTLDATLLEDEVWTKIRLAPESLPTGEIEIIPGLQFARLRHTPLKVETATATLTATGELQVYTIAYKKLKRKLAIKFEKDFPHRIMAWEESQMSGYGPNAKMMTTRAVKTNSILLDYWSRNKLSDSYLRDELGLIY